MRDAGPVRHDTRRPVPPAVAGPSAEELNVLRLRRHGLSFYGIGEIYEISPADAEQVFHDAELAGVLRRQR